MHDKRFTNIDQLYFNDINIYYIYVLAYNWSYLNKDSNFFEGIFYFLRYLQGLAKPIIRNKHEKL